MKVISISLAVVAMIGWLLTHDEPVAGGEVAVFGLLTIVGVTVGLGYFRSFRRAETAPQDEDRQEMISG